jgi:hypothetical protein
MPAAQSVDDRYESVVRACFGLTPKELATLCAIGVFCQVQEGLAMPRFELERVAAKPDMDGVYALCLAAPGRLERLGLIELRGNKEHRSYRPTPTGWQRLRR